MNTLFYDVEVNMGWLSDSFLGDIYYCVVEPAVDTVLENPGKTVAVVAATVATGGLACAAAPAIGAAVSAAGFGVAGGTLSGAAASSAGLAALGGGSIASGGLGMAGGTALVTGVGAATGAAASGGAIALAKDDKA